MKIVYNKFVLTNIISNALTVSSTADVSIYKKRLKKSKIVWTVTHVTACHQLELNKKNAFLKPLLLKNIFCC